MSHVQQFMTGRSILVTGFTGFLGKLLVTKLLSSCPDIDTVFVLIRKGKHPNVEDRFARIIQSKVFEKVKEHDSGFADKIATVEGDLTLPDLGMSEVNKNLIMEKVSVVFNLAQNSKCDSHLRDAVDVNVLGARNLLSFSLRIRKLVSLTQLSTLYSNCNHPSIGEMIYQPALLPRKLLSAHEWLTDDVFRDIESFLTKGHANAYTYTKALTEYLIQEEFSSLPVSIVRPAIIGSTWREPFPDWIDSPNGIVPVVHASGKGQLRVLKGSPKSTAEIIPADIVVNALISAAWYESLRMAESEADRSVRVYNLTSNAARRLTWHTLEEVVCSSFRKNPLSSVLRIPKASMTKNSLVYNIKGMMLHFAPAYIADIINLLLGRSPHYVNNNQQFMKLLTSAQYFTTRDWMIENNNMKHLMSKLSSVDKKMFGLDTSCTHWPSYIEGLCLGVKQYVAREPLSGLPAARKSINRIKWADRFWMVVGFLVSIRLASTRVQWAKKLWSLILTMSMYIYSKIPNIAKS